MKALAEMLDQCWDSVYKSYMMATYYDGSNSHELGNVVSSFGHSLTNKAWLPSVDLAKKPYSNDGSSPLLQGNQLYQDVDKLKHLLHCHVPYLRANLRSYDFIQHLQVKVDVTSKELLEYLCNWSEKASIRTTTEHMKHVYMFLAQAYEEKNEIGRAFSNRDLIFVPSITEWRNNSLIDIDGTFVSVHKTCWADETTVLFKFLKNHQSYPFHLPQILGFFYSGFDENTKEKIKYAFSLLGVRKDMNLENLISLFEFNASLTSSPEDSHIDAFRSIAEVILKIITSDEGISEVEQKFFLANVRKKAIFPSKSKKWVSLESLYIDDDPDISKHFSKHEKVHFLHWPANKSVKGWLKDELPNPFTEICLIPRISECVHTQLNPSSVRPYYDLQKTFHYMIPLIQQYIVSNVEHPSSLNYYEGIAELLKRLQFLSTIELTCTYSIDEHFAHASIKQCRFDDDSSQPVVYVVVNEDGKILEKSSLPQVVCQIILPKNVKILSFQQFVQEMLMDDVSSEEDTKRYIEKYGLKPVPANLPQWSIGLPYLPKPVPTEEPAELEPLDEQTDLEILTSNKENTLGNTEGGLKAWPPRAPVRMEEGHGAKKSTRISNKDGERERKLTERDVITVEDVRRMQQAAGQKEEPDDDAKAKKDNTTIRQPSSNQSDVIHKNPAAKKSESQTPSHALVSQQLTPPQTGTTKPQQMLKQSTSSTSKEETTTAKESTEVVPRNKANSSEVSKLKKPNPYFADVKSIDITSLMKSLPIQVDRNLFTQLVPNEDRKEEKLEVGKWGEEFVFNVLKHHRKLPNGVEIKSIIWLNEHIESGLPYDIKVISTHDEMEYYIEVKSTISVDRALIPISWKELQFAQQVKEAHLLLCVYGVRRKVEEVEIKWLSDVFSLIENNPSVTLYIKM